MCPHDDVVSMDEFVAVLRHIQMPLLPVCSCKQAGWYSRWLSVDGFGSPAQNNSLASIPRKGPRGRWSTGRPLAQSSGGPSTGNTARRCACPSMSRGLRPGLFDDAVFAVQHSETRRFYCSDKSIRDRPVDWA